MKKVCVFCGSSFGAGGEYRKAAVVLGDSLVERKLELVYGGARVGLMGEIASTVLKGNGYVTGVIPKQLQEKEVAHTELTDLRVTGSMHERKAMMAELSDGFIAMPGGLGTIEEIFEVLTWAQLGFHHKPCGFLNVAGYYDHLIKFLDHTVQEEFIHPGYRSMILVDDNPEALLDKMESYQPPKVDKAKVMLDMLNRNQTS